MERDFDACIGRHIVDWFGLHSVSRLWCIGATVSRANGSIMVRMSYDYEDGFCASGTCPLSNESLNTNINYNIILNLKSEN